MKISVTDFLFRLKSFSNEKVSFCGGSKSFFRVFSLKGSNGENCDSEKVSSWTRFSVHSTPTIWNTAAPHATCTFMSDKELKLKFSLTPALHFRSRFFCFIGKFHLSLLSPLPSAALAWYFPCKVCWSFSRKTIRKSWKHFLFSWNVNRAIISRKSFMISTRQSISPLSKRFLTAKQLKQLLFTSFPYHPQWSAKVKQKPTATASWHETAATCGSLPRRLSFSTNRSHKVSSVLIMS
jgi:hypothetical protein